jgi:hypothetical protein
MCNEKMATKDNQLVLGENVAYQYAGWQEMRAAWCAYATAFARSCQYGEN